jgi:hypothetical protein
VAQGTDLTFLEKAHDAFESHVNYIKGEVKSRWNLEFAINHFAGPGMATDGGVAGCS